MMQKATKSSRKAVVAAPTQELIPRKPHEFSQPLFDAICIRMADGESLNAICRDPAMPYKNHVFNWIAANKDIANQYARACELRTDGWFEELYEAATDGRNDYYDRPIYNAQGALVRTERVLDAEAVARSRLRVDALKWMMSKGNPKKYGDKLDLNVGGQVDNPLRVEAVPFTALDPIEAARRYQELMSPKTDAAAVPV
jgi:hypothetical protein